MALSSDVRGHIDRLSGRTMATPVYGALTAVYRAFRLLSLRDRRRFFLVVLVQVLLSLLDVLGVLLLTAVGVLAVQIARGGTLQLPGALELGSTLVARSGFDLEQATFGVAVATGLFFLVKGVLSVVLLRRILLFLANRQAGLSASLMSRLLNQSTTDIQSRSTLTTAYAVVQGATSAVVGILGSAATVISESVLLLVLFTVLLFLEPAMTIMSSVFLGLTAIVVYTSVSAWSARIGVLNARTAILGNTLVQDSLLTFREISVSHRRGFFLKNIRDLLILGARAQADNALISQIPRYVFESALIIGAVLLAGLLFATTDVARAIATLVLFLAAGSRVLPAIMRLQAAVITIRSSAGSSVETFLLADRVYESTAVLPDERDEDEIRREIIASRDDFIPDIRIRNLAVWYPDSTSAALNGVTLEIDAGSSVALVGPTGAGKSTLADALLGTIRPTAGDISVGGLSPEDAIERWPGGIAYVPQVVSLVEGTVRDNVALGLPPGAVTDDEVWDALVRAHIADFLKENRDGLETRIGERGVRLSGGQRQRLGIARALLSHPKLLVMDEATSALDAQTELLIAEVMQSLRGATTLVVVAHRLATVREFAHLVYLEAGAALAQGSFDEVRTLVPNFERQAQLLGL